jgi:Zn-dependent M28 family amino/carboxypeptidase
MRWIVGLTLSALVALAPGCTVLDVSQLTQEALRGRNNDTPGSALARAYLIDELRPFARGANTSATGDAAYLQTINGGTNVVAVIPGTDLADEYVVVGAHYDGLGDTCASPPCSQDTIRDGATDNATGVAAALDVGRAIAASSTKPRRSVVLAFWDREEDGLLGSAHYVQNPLVPLADTVGYVNFDIQGANLLPSLRRTTFAVGAETGGARLRDIITMAAAGRTVETTQLSAIFGQNRSDYVNFINRSIPTVFFTDATGPCYHTVDDEIGVVDFRKLDDQVQTALATTRELANTANPPAFVAGTPLATYDDAVASAAVVELAYADRGRFSAADQQTLTQIRDDARRLVAEGRAAFGSDDVGVLLGAAARFVEVLTHGTCSGFLDAAGAR